MKRWCAQARSSLVLAAFAFACQGRSTQPDRTDEVVSPGSTSSGAVQIDLTRGAPEEVAGGGLFSLPVTRHYPGLLEALQAIRSSDQTRGVLVRLGGVRFDWARSEEIGRLLEQLRSAQRKVVCHAHSLSNTSLLLALRGCDKIWLSPAGDVDAVGIAGQALYLRELLDRFNVHAQFLHVGRYKSAAETVTQSEPSDAAREAMQSVLGSIRTSWLDAVAKARPGSEAKLEQGPYDPQTAKDLGLIDEIGYESQAEDDLKALVGASEIETTFGLVKRRDAAREILDLIELLVGVKGEAEKADHVALVVATGGIQMESGGMLSSEGIAFRPLAKTLRRLREDDSVRAVVLRISSPGGSALASDLLWHELTALREKKPLVASVGDMAASGGYYMACAANQIFAERTSIVGSIGVVGGKLVVGDALRDFGINSVTFSASEDPATAQRATYMSALTPWDEATQAQIQKQMQSVYQLFLSRVAEGRAVPVDQVAQVAEGRIWSGAQGIDNKLVDVLGGLDDAMARARELAELGADAPVVVEGAGETLLDLLSLDEHASEDDVRAALQRLRARAPGVLSSVSPQLRPFGAMLQPLLQGERVLAVMPQAISVQ